MPPLNSQNVPPNLRDLIPLAERFGISDDLYREKSVSAATPIEIAHLKAAIAMYDEDLDEWLAGPEARGPEFSVEYIAFSAMRMAADFA
jgi:hypothetical protein